MTALALTALCLMAWADRAGVCASTRGEGGMMKYVDTHELSEPWAQRAWRIDFKIFTGHQPRISRLQARKRMLKIRREAALERALEASQREIDRLQREIVELRNEIGIINHANEEYSLLCDFKEDLL